MSNNASPTRTIFVYTEEQRGNQLVESVVVGMLSDVSGSEKLIVVRDPQSGFQFVYRVQHETNNLDAAAITDLPPMQFDGRSATQFSGMTFRMGTPDTALRLLRGKPNWIQDKGCVLSVLLQNAAARRPILIGRQIQRERITKIPRDAQIEYLADRFASGNTLPEDDIQAAATQPLAAQPTDALEP
ncbi:Uncharacterised protein [Bordetella ansorpii]|jgi:hypothetical protein|uniref:Uncharacterized protein n=1 Tax=Bordetella ansorpii TaxID=288768 RepID=A0A157MBV7_9BORD|nr:hypothetical protein [Bordetella ansorpii]SAI06488.1 Uncharacterised protein [Bordetella ansorpii]